MNYAFTNAPIGRGNPDILSFFANLSSDENFTPVEIADAMLDTLPQNLFESPDTKFLDPACKDGVFLRQIAMRLIKGLEKKFPDLQERVDHIFHEQIYGIGITEVTALMTRRTLYCSKDPACQYSVTHFGNEQGNIKFNPKLKHTFNDTGKDKGKCKFCGAAKKNYDRGGDREAYAYNFIHMTFPGRIFNNMKFDVIISNPPYQLSDGGFGRSASPIYQKFVEVAKRLEPEYICMIIPSRWFTGGKGLKNFREDMLNDRRIKIIHDYPEASDCFKNGVQIKGGICYFLWDSDYEGDCTIIRHRGEEETTVTRPLREANAQIFIRFNEAVPVIAKIKAFQEKSFETLVSSQKPFGFRTYFHGARELEAEDKIKCYDNEGAGYVVPEMITKNKEWIDKWKVFIPASGSGSDSFPHSILGKPFIGAPKTCCSETYMVIGPFEDEATAQNVISYITTKFFRFLVLQRKSTQHAPAKVYQLVPLQDFSKPWTDKELYEKYHLDQNEIDFIESMIRPMNLEKGEK